MSLGGKNLGGGMQGIAPKQTVLNYKNGEQTAMRSQLRRAWNTSYATGTVNGKKRIVTPFRAVNNSGDFLARQNYVCGGPEPNSLHRSGIRKRFGSIISQCDGSGVEASNTNTKYVPDSSEYIRYKKQSAVNNTYNDYTFGGYNNSAYSTYMRIGRFV
jgi:hypothetical protein